MGFYLITSKSLRYYIITRKLLHNFLHEYDHARLNCSWFRIILITAISMLQKPTRSVGAKI